MKYCQHSPVLRIRRAGLPAAASIRPRDKKTSVFLDGLGGTQVQIHDDVVGFDVAFGIRTGCIVSLPCAEHPGEISPEEPSARNSPAKKGAGS